MRSLEFGKSQRKVENRKKWRKVVAKSSVVPPTTLAVKELMMMMMVMKVCVCKLRGDTETKMHFYIHGLVCCNLLSASCIHTSTNDEIVLSNEKIQHQADFYKLGEKCMMS